MLTLEDIKERMCYRMDSYEILERLQIETEELVDAFEDKILRKFEELEEEMLDYEG